MFPFGGVGVMLALIATAGVVSAAVAAGLSRRFGWPWSVLAGLLLWSVVVIGVLTLIPANGAPGIVSAEGRLTTCSWDIGGPAPDGFWILPGGQRMLNARGLRPGGGAAGARRRALEVGVGHRARWDWRVLAAYSTADRATPSSAAARIDRACDVTDIIDNVTGAGVGVLIGIALLPVVRPWRMR